MKNDNILIQLEDIKKQYQPDTPFVLKGISMGIYKNDFISLMGASGSGKTTLMNIIGLLDTPTTGKLFIDGNDVSTLDDTNLSKLRNIKIGFIFQSFYLIPYLNVLENVLLPRFYSGLDMSEGKDYALKLLERFGMADKLKSKPSELSGGQQQRVAIARSLINNPQLILADEPTGQLDSSTSKTIMEYISTLPESGCAVLLVTHDLATSEYARRKVVIKDGLLVG